MCPVHFKPVKPKNDFNLLINNGIWHVRAFSIYIFAITLTKFVNSGLEEGFHAFFRLCQDYFVFLWVLSFVNKSSASNNLVKRSLLFAAVISVIYGILQFIDLDIFNRQVNINRLSGFHKNPYSYGGQLIVFFFFLLGTFFEKKINYKSTIFLSACLFCIFNTSERAVIFGVIAGIIFYLIFQRLYKNIKITKSKFWSWMTILFIPILLTIAFNIKAIKRLIYAITSIKDRKINARFKIWNIALAVWKKNLLFGAGKFPVIYHQAGNEFSVQVLTHAHNVFLQFLATAGVIGLFAFLNLFYSIIQFLIKNIKSSDYVISALAVLVAFFIEGLFEYFWGDSEVRYLLLYFIGFVVGNLSKSENMANHE